MKKTNIIELEVYKPDRGSFLKFDGESQAEIRVLVDGSQRANVELLNSLPYGETFKIMIPFLKGK